MKRRQSPARVKTLDNDSSPANFFLTEDKTKNVEKSVEENFASLECRKSLSKPRSKEKNLQK